MSKEDVDYVLIPGDTLDYYNVIDNKEVYDTIKKCFKLLADSNKKVIMILGNHDYFIRNRKKACNYEFFSDCT